MNIRKPIRYKLKNNRIKHKRKEGENMATVAMDKPNKTNLFNSTLLNNNIKEVQESYKHYKKNKNQYKAYENTDEMFKDMGINLQDV